VDELEFEIRAPELALGTGIDLNCPVALLCSVTGEGAALGVLVAVKIPLGEAVDALDTCRDGADSGAFCEGITVGVCYIGPNCYPYIASAVDQVDNAGAWLQG
jgi:hypothetical protein